jgi:hypothetical protein
MSSASFLSGEAHQFLEVGQSGHERAGSAERMPFGDTLYTAFTGLRNSYPFETIRSGIVWRHRAVLLVSCTTLPNFFMNFLSMDYSNSLPYAVGVLL